MARTKHSKIKSGKTKLVRLFETKKLQMIGLPLQGVEILENYIKHHIIDGEPIILRELCRLVHRMLPPSPQKSKMRGILGKN